jgi:leucyl-tRNA synthetase
MSYVTLLQQHRTNLIEKVIKSIESLEGEPIDFHRMFSTDISVYDGVEKWIVTGINEDGLLTGRSAGGDFVDFDITGLDMETLSYILDQLLEVNYYTLTSETI